MKQLLFAIAAVLCASGVFAQKSVALVRHITMVGGKENEQRLVISKANGENKTIALQQRYSDIGNQEQIESDNQVIIKEFTELLNEGYRLVESNGTAGGYTTQSNHREIIYIFVKD